MGEAMAVEESVIRKSMPAMLVGPQLAGMRTVVIVSADSGLRERLRVALSGLRWQVREARGGAEAIIHLDSARAEAMLLDSWLPDLEVSEFAIQLQQLYPAMDIVNLDGGVASDGIRSPRRNELLHALREVQGPDEEEEVTRP
jgi:CheY-like chemotaxis protein